MTTTTVETDPAVRQAADQLIRALEAAGYLAANLDVTIWPNALPTLDGSPRRTHIDATLTVRVPPKREPITIDVVRAVTPANPLAPTVAELDPHVDDLVLARTAITPGRRYFTCARFGHSIDPRDFVHTTGPCPDDQTPSTTLPASSESHA